MEEFGDLVPLTTQALPAGCRCHQITCTAPVNIAVIKYWGKRDSVLNLPINSSLSGTIHQDDMKTTTTVTAFKPDTSSAPLYSHEQITLFLNGQKQDLGGFRIQSCLNELKARSCDIIDPESGQIAIRSQDWADGSAFMIIESNNNFPTAAGLASSAAGFGCLVAAVGRLLNVKGDLTAIARRGSGSAARSLHGGWVKWEMGSKKDGSDSIGLQVANELHWPQVKVLIFVVSGEKKDVGSTDGMQLSVATSPLINERIQVVPERMKQMESAILNRDFETFARLTMVDSDHFHQVCHTTQPPIHYMNDTSRFITRLVCAYNQLKGSARVAYTFDAGPNAVIYILEDDMLSFLRLSIHFLSMDDRIGQDSSQLLRTRDSSLAERVVSTEIPPVQGIEEALPAGSVGHIIHTQVSFRVIKATVLWEKILRSKPEKLGPGPVYSQLRVFSHRE